MNDAESKRIILVVGSGRSGTSAIAKALEIFGVSLGNNLMPAKENVNDKGFWEDLDFYNFNKEFYDSMNFEWNSLRLVDFDNFSFEEKNEWSARAKKILENKLSSVKIFGVKDPQLTRLLPFWMDVFRKSSLEDGYVIACRNPKSVAHSLAKHSGMSIEKSYVIWFVYTLMSLVYTKGKPRLVVSYENMLQNPQKQLMRISNCLKLDFQPEGDLSRMYSQEFLDKNLSHHELHFDTSLESLGVPKECIHLYNEVMNFASDISSIDDSESVVEIDRLWENYINNSFLLNCAQRMEEELVATREILRERTEELVATREILRERTERLEEISKRKIWVWNCFI